MKEGEKVVCTNLCGVVVFDTPDDLPIHRYNTGEAGMEQHDTYVLLGVNSKQC